MELQSFQKWRLNIQMAAVCPCMCGCVRACMCVQGGRCRGKVNFDTFGHPENTRKTREKSKIGNKSCRASKFSISGHHYTDVMDADSISGAAASADVSKFGMFISLVFSLSI